MYIAELLLNYCQMTESLCTIMAILIRMLDKEIRGEFKRIDKEIHGVNPEKHSIWDKLFHPSLVQHEKHLARMKKLQKQHYNRVYYWTHREEESARHREYYRAHTPYVPTTK